MHGELLRRTTAATRATLSRWTSEAMTAPTLHAQVLALRRTHSARAVAQALKQFCMDALALVPLATDGWGRIDQAQANAAFAQHPDMVPHTLADCLHELEYWDALYQLRQGWDNAGDELPEVYARRCYLDSHCLSTIRPKSRDEGKAVLRFMAKNEMFNRSETDAVLENLVG